MPEHARDGARLSPFVREARITTWLSAVNLALTLLVCWLVLDRWPLW